jgi:hypothetical protein
MVQVVNIDNSKLLQQLRLGGAAQAGRQSRADERVAGGGRNVEWVSNGREIQRLQVKEVELMNL